MRRYRCFLFLTSLWAGIVDVFAVEQSFRFTTVDGRVQVFSFQVHNSSQCLYTNVTENREYIACMNDQSYNDVETTWQTKGSELQYVKVNCLLQDSIRRFSQYCVCKSKPSDVNFACQISTLNKHIFNTTRKLQVLDLSFNKIENIGPQTFNGLDQIRYISLRNNNRISVLPYGLLCDAPRLEYLDLSDLDLDVFPSHIFKCGNVTSRLKAIEISNSKLIDIPKGSLGALTSLESLHLGNNSIGKLHKNSFVGASSLMDINVTDNLLYDLFPEFCSALPELRTLLLRKNEFQVFNFDEIKDCYEMKTLDISVNNITAFSGSMFTFTSLESFNISHNHLASFNLDLRNLSHLMYLDFSHNSICELDPKNLTGLNSLQEFQIHHNCLSDTNMFPELFSGLQGLVKLDISYNKLTHIQANSFVKLKNLTFLNLANNNLSTLHNGSLTGLEDLRELHLENNVLTSLPSGVFRSLSALEYLSLGNNRIAELAMDFWPKSIEFLYLFTNKLTSVPRNIDYNSLKFLDVSDNQLTGFNFEGQKATNLTKIDLSSNQLTNVSIDFSLSVPNLEHLNLDNNKLTLNVSADTFRGAVNVRWLSLANNQIKGIGNVFREHSLNSLKALNLSNNPLEVITQINSASTVADLEEIDLSNCKITSLDSNTFAYLESLISVNLSNNGFETFKVFNASVNTTFNFSGNPITCSCHMIWLKDPYVEINNKRIPIYKYNVPNCSAHGLEGLYSPRALRRDQYLCVEQNGCDSQCSCFKKESKGDIYTVECRKKSEVPNVIPSSAHTIYLDGNNFVNSSFEQFSTFRNMTARELYMNGSMITNLHPEIFSGFPYLEIISLAGNELTSIPPKLFVNKTKLKQLYLQKNQLSDFESGTFKELDGLEELDITNNNFKYLNADTIAELSALPAIKYYFLSNNSWRCDCRNVDFKNFVNKFQYKIRDRRQLVCNGEEIIYVPKSAFTCTTYDKPQINYAGKTVIVVISCIVALFIICAACLYFRRDCVAILYAGTGIHIPSRQRYVSGKPFDVFLSYDPADQHASEYVQKQLLPKLRISRHHCQTSHDLIQDTEVTKKAIEDSKCSVFVINKNFATNSFLVKVFHIATDYSKLGHHKVILLIHGDVDILTLEPEIVTRLHRGDYITARSRLWWWRLKYELPVSTKYSENIRHDDEESEADTIIFSAIADEGYYNSMEET